MVIREQHLKVAVIATFDYSCLSNQETVEFSSRVE